MPIRFFFIDISFPFPPFPFDGILADLGALEDGALEDGALVESIPEPLPDIPLLMELPPFPLESGGLVS